MAVELNIPTNEPTRNITNLTLVGKFDIMRPIVERFAHRAYNDTYGANIKSYSNEFLTLYSRDKGVLSCLGINDTSIKPLFLEQYLDGPVEVLLEKITGKRVNRESIVEVGTLAVTSQGMCRLMMSALAGLMAGRGKSYLVFTAVRTIRNTLRRLGVPFTIISKASKTKLTNSTNDWGRYYKSDPEVIVVDLNVSWGLVNQVLDNLKRDETDLSDLMRDFYHRGAALETTHTSSR